MSQRAELSTHVLDSGALYKRLDQVRRDAGVSWRQVGREAGVPPLTFTRLARGGYAPSANALVSLLAWLENTDAAEFIKLRHDPKGAS